MTTESDANFLKSLDDLDGFDFWSLARLLGTEATVMVHPEQQESFETSLSERTIQHEILNDDLEK